MKKAFFSYPIYVYADALPYCEAFLKEKKLSYKIIDTNYVLPKDEKAIVYKINKGKFLQPCPGTPHYICCGYYVLSPVENCPFSCTYCILNAYFKTNHIVVYVNIDKMLQELETIDSKLIKRIGTGEFSDSIAIEATRFYLPKLLEFFEKRPDLFLELKTKSNYIPEEFYKKLYKNVIFAWSLNSKKIAKEEELKTASITERLKSAKIMTELGYKVSFHFDPIIYYEGWESDYKETIEELFSEINPKSIVWISLGTLRFIPQLKDTAMTLYPNTDIFDGEFIKGLDGKSRYFRKKRVAIYKTILKMIRAYDRDVFIYLCMENRDVWQEVFSMPMTSKWLKELMDERV